jgi:MFS family permease
MNDDRQDHVPKGDAPEGHAPEGDAPKGGAPQNGDRLPQSAVSRREVLRRRLKHSNLVNYARNLDLFGVEGVHSRHHKGLKQLWLFGFLLSCAGAFYASYLPLYLLSIGATRTQIGWLSSAASFFGMLSPIPGALIARRWGKPRLHVALFAGVRRFALLFAAIAPLLLSGQLLIFAVIGVLSLRFLFIGLYNPALVSLFGSVIPEEIRGRYMGTRKMVMALASAILVPLAGWMIGRVGEPEGYQVGLVISFVFGVLGAYAVMRIPELSVQSGVEADQNGGSIWDALRTNRLFLWYLVIRFFWNFSRQLGGPYFRVYQKEVLLSPTAVIGILVTVSSISRLIGQRFWGELVDRKGPRWVLSLCALAIPALPFIWIFATKPWHIVFVSLPSGFLWAGFQMGGINLLLDLPDESHRTSSAALNTTVLRLANMVAPFVGDWIIRQWSYELDFAISGIGRLIAALLFVFVLRPFKTPASSNAKTEAEPH